MGLFTRASVSVLVTMSWCHVVVVVTCCFVLEVTSHGRLAHPPARATAWRYGFNTPANYNDNELFCGGFTHQWQKNGGKCGICGDPYDGVRENEAGGRYATGTIVADYTEGQVIDVTVDITANHLGYVEFRLCPHNNIHTPATQDCFDRHIVALADGTGTRLPILAGMFLTKLKLKLPSGVTCSQCILQWKYNTGNRWGTDSVTGQSGLGYGPQEQFYGCADISIRGQGWTTSKKPLTTTARPATTTARATTTTAAPTAKSTPTASPTSRPTSCWAVNEFEGVVAMDKWCQDNCLSGYCPASMCECASDKMPSTASPVKTTAKAPASTSRPSMCWAINEWEGQASVDAWCLHSCLTGICPENMCECI